VKIEQLIEKLQKRVDKEGLRETARFLGLDASTVHKYINGQRSPSGENVLILMEKLR